MSLVVLTALAAIFGIFSSIHHMFGHPAPTVEVVDNSGVVIVIAGAALTMLYLYHKKHEDK